jgi:hypothetical protein
MTKTPAKLEAQAEASRQAKEDPFPFVVGGAIAGAALIIGLSRRGGRRELIGPR